MKNWKALFSVLSVVLLVLVLAGCKDSKHQSEHPGGDHQESEHPTGEKKSEHPSGSEDEKNADLPSSEDSKEEKESDHPSEHPE